MSLWQRLVDRFVPELPDQPSRLDRLDGVGRRRGQRAAGEHNAPAPRIVLRGSSKTSPLRRH